jgi:hypothetical protein
MARINIEDGLFADARFQRLARILNGNSDQALGMLVRFWQLAQKHWGDEMSLVPEDEFTWGDFAPLLETKFAEKREGGYYARGSEQRFNWYLELCRKSRKGGVATKKKHQNEGPTAIPTAGPTAHHTASPEDGPTARPLSLALALDPDLLNTKKISDHERKTPIVAKCNAPKSKAVTKPPDGGSRVSLQGFFGSYVEAYSNKFGVRPAITKKDQGIARRIVDSLGESQARLAVQVYLQLSDAWFQTKHYDLGTMEQNLNKVVAALQTGKSSEQSADEKYWKEVWGDDGAGKVPGTDQAAEADVRGQGLPTGKSPVDIRST